MLRKRDNKGWSRVGTDKVDKTKALKGLGRHRGGRCASDGWASERSKWELGWQEAACARRCLGSRRQCALISRARQNMCRGMYRHSMREPEGGLEGEGVEIGMRELGFDRSRTRPATVETKDEEKSRLANRCGIVRRPLSVIDRARVMPAARCSRRWKRWVGQPGTYSILGGG